MKHLITTLFQKFRHLILYGVIGSFSSGTDFLIYTLLVQFVGVQYLISNCISVLVGISTSFVLNRSLNFKVKDHTKRRFVMFLTVGLSGLIISNVILYLCVEALGKNELVSKLLSIVLVVFLQFLANKYVTFKPSATEDV